MKKIVWFALAASLFAGDFRSQTISKIDNLIHVYKQRIECLQTNETTICINRYPADTQSDALAKTFAMSFPKAFYIALLKRDITMLEKAKLCYGKALDEYNAKSCPKM